MTSPSNFSPVVIRQKFDPGVGLIRMQSISSPFGVGDNLSRVQCIDRSFGSGICPVPPTERSQWSYEKKYFEKHLCVKTCVCTVFRGRNKWQFPHLMLKNIPKTNEIAIKISNQSEHTKEPPERKRSWITASYHRWGSPHLALVVTLYHWCSRWDGAQTGGGNFVWQQRRCAGSNPLNAVRTRVFEWKPLIQTITVEIVLAEQITDG